jgi:hypothetical protein
MRANAWPRCWGNNSWADREPGRRSGPELERVWSHVQACAQCRADLALMHTWRHVLHAAGAGGDAPCDAERALARLGPALDAGDGGARRATASRAGRARLAVVFRPDTPEHELRRIVRANGARIVGGPTTADAWLLATCGEPAQVLLCLYAEAAVEATCLLPFD